MLNFEQVLTLPPIEVHPKTKEMKRAFYTEASQRIWLVSSEEMATISQALVGESHFSSAQFFSRTLKMPEGTTPNDWLQDQQKNNDSIYTVQELADYIAQNNTEKFAPSYLNWLNYFLEQKSSIQEKKLITHLLILINQDFLLGGDKQEGDNFFDILPCIIEHEVFEAWLTVKQGIGETFTSEQRHFLALIHEYAFAHRMGKLDRLFSFHQNIVDTFNIPDECFTLAYLRAKRKLR
jgi:hypothetical protein